MKASIELISNAGQVADRPIAEYIREAIVGRFPIVLLGAFLHEGTHHWCLSSPVGTAIAAISMQLHRECATRPESLLFPSTVPIQPRVSSITRILEPLLEGLAQFAEFDLYTGTSSVSSSVANWTMKLFSHWAVAPPDTDCFVRLRYVLMMWRTSDEAIRRKSAVLARPLTLENGGYLLGYLTIKNSWLTAQRHSKRLRNPDLFLMYLRSLIFDDLELAEMLLAPPMDEYKDVNRLIAHVHARLKLLSQDDLDERVGRFEAVTESGEGLNGHWDVIYLDSERALSGREKLSKFVHDTGASAMNYKIEAPLKAETAIAIMDSGSLLSRQCLRIRVDHITVDVEKDSSMVKYADVPLFSAATIRGAPQGTNAGLLGLYFLPEYMIPALVCTAGQSIVCAYLPTPASQEISDETRQGLVGAMAQVLFAEGLRGTINHLAQIDDFENIDLGEYQRFVPKVTPAITNLYLNHALCFVPDNRLYSCQEIMQQHGFWDLLSARKDPPDKKAGRVQALAALGLVASCVTDRKLVAGIIESQGFALDDVLADLASCFDKNGYPLTGESIVPNAEGDTRNITCFV